jgi:hypothetical protein
MVLPVSLALPANKPVWERLNHLVRGAAEEDIEKMNIFPPLVDFISILWQWKFSVHQPSPSTPL